ncbi:hypothetical protein HK105_205160 [Polyrhizophydium stewartii]|uniref:Uncharacterized protein n=1 Tax=Polyrhizophydium stewartii TaxID=2732419 RepID=A0ABR4N6Y5_9FUNG|nr:hypothetical protein HK105_002458 [Polyrhizophydium stewartii]
MARNDKWTMVVNGQRYETTEEDRRVFRSAARSLSVRSMRLKWRVLGRLFMGVTGGIIGLYYGTRFGYSAAMDRLESLPESPMREMLFKLRKRLPEAFTDKGLILEGNDTGFVINTEPGRIYTRENRMRIIADTPDGRKEWVVSGPGVEGRVVNISAVDAEVVPSAQEIENLFRRKRF